MNLEKACDVVIDVVDTKWWKLADMTAGRGHAPLTNILHAAVLCARVCSRG